MRSDTKYEKFSTMKLSTVSSKLSWSSKIKLFYEHLRYIQIEQTVSN